MMNSKKISVAIALIGFLLAVTYFFLYTPWGVHTYGETLFGGNDVHAFEKQDFPSEVNGKKAIAQTIQFPKVVMQPSGIDYDPEKQAFFLVTDQAEIIELSDDLQQVNSLAVTSDKPLLFRQGTVESTDFYQNKMYIGGDLGAIEIWEKTDNGWQKTGAIDPPPEIGEEIGAEALAINPNNGDIYIGKEGPITIIDSQGKFIKELPLQMTTKDGRSVSEYIAAGMDFYGGVLYILTEYHSAILAVDPDTGEVKSVYALEGGFTEGAGLTVTNDKFFVVVDHELNEARPGVKVYQKQNL